MTGRIAVKRIDHPEHTSTRHRKTITIPAHYKCYYYWNGMEVAWYDSVKDTVYLKTELLGHDFKKPMLERMKTSTYAHIWADLTEFLNINQDTQLGEYMYE